MLCKDCELQPGSFSWVFGAWLCKACKQKAEQQLEETINELESEPNSGWGVFNEN